MLPDASLPTGSSGDSRLRHMKASTRTEMLRNSPGASAVQGENRGSRRPKVVLRRKQPRRWVLQEDVDGTGPRADP